MPTTHAHTRNIVHWPQCVLVICLIAMLGLGATATRAATRVIDEDNSSGYISAIAPDGRSVAFVHDVFSINSKIIVVALATGQRITLKAIRNDEYIHDIHWSPDSDWLVATVYEIGQNAHYARIEAFAADGAQTIIVSQIAYACEPLARGCFLEWIGFSSTSEVIYRLANSTSAAIYRQPLNGPSTTAVRLNPDNLHPDYCIESPTLHWIACTGSYRVFTLAVDGDRSQAHGQLTYTNQEATPQIVFSPRGTHLLIERSFFGSGDMLYSAAPDSNDEPMLLTPQPFPYSFPFNNAFPFAVTPDDRTVIIAQPVGLMHVPISGPASAGSLLVPNVSTPEVAYYDTFMLSGDGQRLIVTRSAAWALIGYAYDPSLLGVFSIPINDSADGTIQLIADKPMWITLSTDGRSMIYQPSTSNHLAIVPVAGPANAIHDIVLNGEGSSFISAVAVRDSFLLQGNNNLYTIPSDGHRDAEPIFDDQGDAWRAPMNLDASGLLLIKNYRTQQVYLADLGTLQAGFATSNVCIAETDGSLRIPIVLSSPPAEQRSLSYHVSGGSAQSDDYTLPGNGTLTFPSGERFQSIPLQVAADSLSEGVETLDLMLESTDHIELTGAKITISIRDQGSCQSALPIVRQQ